MDLLYKIVQNDCRKNCILHSPKWKFELIPDYKSLWNAPDNKGLPIGNLTSQFFSNVYLNELDQYVKHHWQNWYETKSIDTFVKSINSYIGLLRNINGYNLRKKICLSCVNLFIGCDKEYTKIYSNFSHPLTKHKK